jgi:hypothetical protein
MPRWSFHSSAHGSQRRRSSSGYPSKILCRLRSCFQCQKTNPVSPELWRIGTRLSHRGTGCFSRRIPKYPARFLRFVTESHRSPLGDLGPAQHPRGSRSKSVTHPASVVQWPLLTSRLLLKEIVRPRIRVHHVRSAPASYSKPSFSGTSLCYPLSHYRSDRRLLTFVATLSLFMTTPT